MEAIPATPENPSPRVPSILMTVVVILAAGTAVWQCWQHRVTQKTRDWIAGRPEAAVQTLHGYDTNFLQVAGDGNLAIRFLNLNANNPEHVKFAQLMFCRGGYALYPRRAWVVPEGTVVNGGREAIEARFSPSPQWLHDHNVRNIIEVDTDAAGNVRVRAVPVITGGTQ